MLNRKDLVTTLTDAIATDFFLTMLNPSNRAQHFQFGAFNIEGWVRRGLSINLPSPLTARELAQADLRAREKWTQLIEQVGDGIPKGLR